MIHINNIAEYDIKNAGQTALYQEGLIDEKLYKELISYDRKTRQVKTGLLIKENKEWYDIQVSVFKKYIDKFIKLNKIKDYQILEIVKDGLWIIGRKPYTLKFDKIEFIKKQEYTSVFIYKKIYFYVDSFNDTIHVRGVNSDNEVFLDIIKDILIKNEFDIELYDKLHEILGNLKDDELYYGDNLGVNIKNINIIKKLIKEVI